MSGIEVKSYRYLRTALVALLIGLGAAVGYQIVQQGGSLLSSVSAYYYTPAQAIFVGALIGLGACMIALKGTTLVEDVFLNLGGMFAAVVAIVPTARGVDYRTAVRACEQADSPLLTEKAGDLDCPTVRALAQATRANVENNMVALLVVGALALLATVLFFTLRDRTAPGARFPVAGFLAALLVYGAGGGTFWWSREWFLNKAHYVAALGLFVCIVIVAVANALRRDEEKRASGRGKKLNAVPGGLVRSKDSYARFARLMVVVTLVGVLLWLADVISLFVLEIAVALFFVVFWIGQTVERWGDESQHTAPPEREPAQPVG
jgi:hypothetical protein